MRLFIVASFFIAVVQGYNKYCSTDSDCNAPSSYCMNDPTKQTFDVFYCHGDQDFCRGDGDCEAGDYCLNDPPHAPMKKYMCKSSLKSMNKKKANDWCYAQAGSDEKKCAPLVKEKKCTWYASKDGKSGKCTLAKTTDWCYAQAGSDEKKCAPLVKEKKCTWYASKDGKSGKCTLAKKKQNKKKIPKSDACTTFQKVVGDACAESCIPSTVGICPQSIIVKMGGLTKGDCSSAGFTKANGTTSQKAGPCGTLTFKMYLKPSIEKKNFGKKFWPNFHVVASGDNQCFQTRYIDKNYMKQGYVPKKCPSKYNKVTSRTKTQVCAGHSEINVKDCKTKVITIVITKKGLASQVIFGDDIALKSKKGNLRNHNPDKVFANLLKIASKRFHLLPTNTNQCYETAYVDRNFKKQGYRYGACPSKFNVVSDVNKEQVCKHHSEINLKDCKSKIVTISITKKGMK